MKAVKGYNVLNVLTLEAFNKVKGLTRKEFLKLQRSKALSPETVTYYYMFCNYVHEVIDKKNAVKKAVFFSNPTCITPKTFAKLNDMIEKAYETNDKKKIRFLTSYVQKY